MACVLMAAGTGHHRLEGSPDPRADALADYLRDWAASFSLSADVTGVHDTARAGMALLDAAAIAQAMGSNDRGLRVLSEAGLFESMPFGRARFVETPGIRAAIQRPLVAGRQTGGQIIAHLVATAGGEHPRPTEGWRT